MEEEEDIDENTYHSAKAAHDMVPEMPLLPEDNTGHHWHQFVFLCVNLIAWAIPHFSWPVPHFSSLPDGAIIIEADGDECNKKTMKSMSWPLMDDDGLPSSYVSKVLTCLSKWRVKMDGLKEALESTEITDSLKK